MAAPPTICHLKASLCEQRRPAAELYWWWLADGPLDETISARLMASRRKWLRYLLWGTNDILTSFNNYQTAGLQQTGADSLGTGKELYPWSAVPQS